MQFADLKVVVEIEVVQVGYSGKANLKRRRRHATYTFFLQCGRLEK